MGPEPGRPGRVWEERGRGEEVAGGGRGPEAAAHHALRAGGGEAGRVQGGGHHTVVLRLHHRTQPAHGGVHRDGRHRPGGAPRESRPRADEDPGRRR